MKRKLEEIEEEGEEEGKEAVKNVVLLYKPEGWTPLQAINKFKEKKPQYKKLKMSYAGRLDPMAHENVKKQKEFELSKKTYEFEVLWGIQTDSYDILGIPTLLKKDEESIPSIPDNFDTLIEDLLPTFLGNYTQTYPPYSSIRVKGKFLFQWAKENRLNEIELPTSQVVISSLKILKDYSISIGTLLESIPKRISNVTSGDFRQKEIIEAWTTLLKKEVTEKQLKVMRFEAQVSSGTYVRAIAHKLGQLTNLGALALEIFRTRVGDFSLKDGEVLE